MVEQTNMKPPKEIYYVLQEAEAEGIDIPPSVYVWWKTETKENVRLEEFKTLHLATKKEEAEKLQALVVEYHTRTEAYDRSVCTGPIRSDGIMPATVEERKLIGANARQIFNELSAEAIRQGFAVSELQKGISGYRKSYIHTSSD